MENTLAVKRGLDPVAVKAANQALWKEHPELDGRQLKMPEDFEYAAKWNAYYNHARTGSLKKVTSLPILEKRHEICIKCLQKKYGDCGLLSRKCQNALVNGKDENGHDIEPETLARLRATHRVLNERISTAIALGWDTAVDALEHWFYGCGTHKVIPERKVIATREKLFDAHVEKMKERLTNGRSLKKRLAEQIEDKGSYSVVHEFTTEYMGGGRASYLDFVTAPDDSLAYFGESIRSRVVWRCMPVYSSTGVKYECVAKEWRSWVQDSYDFETGKTTPFLPSDDDLLLLQSFGCGQNYPRTSRSWSNDDQRRSLNVEVFYKNEKDIQGYADLRHRSAWKSESQTENTTEWNAPAEDYDEPSPENSNDKLPIKLDLS